MYATPSFLGIFPDSIPPIVPVPQSLFIASCVCDIPSLFEEKIFTKIIRKS